jgi:predicted glycosyltransferase
LKVWIDVLTPKQALFFLPLNNLLRSEGHQTLITTRRYREAQETLRLKRVQHSVVGMHGGGTLLGKLVASGERVVKLARMVGDWHPDVAVSFSSPEATRVAFGLGIPNVAANDSPHSAMVARLTLPLSRFVCFPWIIKNSVWTALGARMDALVSYRALDPAAWLKRFRPSPKVLAQVGVDPDKPIIVLRTEEAFAAYLLGRASDRAPVIEPMISELLKLKMVGQILVSTRYGQQAPVLRRRFGRKIKVVDRVVDASSLLKYASVFVGSGGTMTVESVLLGTPSVSCFPGEKPLYIRYLERQKLVTTIQSPRAVALKVKDVMERPEAYIAQREKGKRLLAWMEDPVEKILGVVKQASR